MNQPATIRVMVVDDHEIIRSILSLSLTVYPDIQVVAEAADGLEAIDLCEQTEPDVILMDLLMPELDGVETTTQIRAQWPAVKIISLTNSVDQSLKRAALAAGVHEFLIKNVSIGQIVAAIHRVVASDNYLPGTPCSV